MKLTTTKKLANILNKEIKNNEKTKNYKISRVEMSERTFSNWVDINIFDNEIDFDYINNKYNVIQVEYPPEYYAVNEYITTKDLTKIYKASNKTWAGFIAKFIEYIEI